MWTLAFVRTGATDKNIANDSSFVDWGEYDARAEKELPGSRYLGCSPEHDPAAQVLSMQTSRSTGMMKIRAKKIIFHQKLNIFT